MEISDKIKDTENKIKSLEKIGKIKFQKLQKTQEELKKVNDEFVQLKIRLDTLKEINGIQKRD